MNAIFKLAITLLFLYVPCVLSANKTFGIVAKSTEDQNFVSAWLGCKHAAEADNNSCVLIGAKGPSHPRTQVNALENATKQNKFDALAISVTKSDHVARAVATLNVPVITFDSPFEYNFSSFSESYVGPDNLQVGKDLARLVKQWYPNGGSVCLMTAAHDSNLDLRLAGIRKELSQNDFYPGKTKLKGEKGWYECSRSPWNSADNITRSMDELKYIIGVEKPDVFIAIGHWPLIDEEMYRETMQPFIENLASGRTKILITLGDNLSEKRIQALMADRLMHGYIKIDFYEIGKASYKVMRDLVEQKNVPKNTFVDTKVQYLKN